MKYVLVNAPESASYRQRELQWTYICESSRVRAGDIVAGEFGYELEYMEVVEVATKRDRLSTEYAGAVKSCRLATDEELDALDAVDKAVAAVNRAEQRMMNAYALLDETRRAA